MPGDVVVISSNNPAYNAVKVQSVAYSLTDTKASVNYVVPSKADTVTITLTSTNPAVTVSPVSNGAVNLRKADDHTAPTEEPGNFKVGDDLYIDILPAYGYQLKKLEVKKTNDGTAVTTTPSSTEGYATVSSIPVGGVTITATFEPKTVVLNFTPTVTGAVPGVVADVSTGNGINESGTTTVSTTFGQTISITPADGYEWASGAMTVKVGGTSVSVSGSGNNGARSFEITDEGTYTITLSLVHK